MNLPSLNRNKNIEFTQEDATAVLIGDFSLRRIQNEHGKIISSLPKNRMLTWIIFCVVAVAVVVVLCHFLKQRKRSAIMTVKNNGKNVTYVKM